MKVVILAWGLGPRISEESQLKPKPMVELGGMPILWHIMKIYSSHGFRDFVICAGYKQHVIKKYFSEGQYQVITAIKCLDEGVNIPGIKTAFIMSSSRNPKEFVQRRGRLLRKSKNKKKAVIYDFITLPREPDNIRQNDIEEDKTIIVGEVARMQEFGRLSDNPEDTDYLINQIMEAYEYYFDAEEEMQRMEEYYGE